MISHSASGVTLQVYFAIIAALLVGLWTDAKPAKPTYEMLCLHLSGWATADEVENHPLKLRNSTGPPGKA